MSKEAVNTINGFKYQPMLALYLAVFHQLSDSKEWELSEESLDDVFLLFGEEEKRKFILFQTKLYADSKISVHNHFGTSLFHFLRTRAGNPKSKSQFSFRFITTAPLDSFLSCILPCFLVRTIVEKVVTYDDRFLSKAEDSFSSHVKLQRNVPGYNSWLLLFRTKLLFVYMKSLQKKLQSLKGKPAGKLLHAIDWLLLKNDGKKEFRTATCRNKNKHVFEGLCLLFGQDLTVESKAERDSIGFAIGLQKEDYSKERFDDAYKKRLVILNKKTDTQRLKLVARAKQAMTVKLAGTAVDCSDFVLTKEEYGALTMPHQRKLLKSVNPKFSKANNPSFEDYANNLEADSTAKSSALDATSLKVFLTKFLELGVDETVKMFSKINWTVHFGSAPSAPSRPVARRQLMAAQTLLKKQKVKVYDKAGVDKRIDEEVDKSDEEEEEDEKGVSTTHNACLVKLDAEIQDFMHLNLNEGLRKQFRVLDEGFEAIYSLLSGDISILSSLLSDILIVQQAPGISSIASCTQNLLTELY